MNNNKTNNEEKNQPVNKIQIGGLQISTWKNANDKGIFLNSQISKSYKDDKTGKWEKSDSFSVTDLMKLQIAINKTIEYCLFESKKIEDD